MACYSNKLSTVETKKLQQYHSCDNWNCLIVVSSSIIIVMLTCNYTKTSNYTWTLLLRDDQGVIDPLSHSCISNNKYNTSTVNLYHSINTYFLYTIYKLWKSFISNLLASGKSLAVILCKILQFTVCDDSTHFTKKNW